MRVIPLCGVLAAFVLLPWTVRAQRFDVVTFNAPPGWTQQVLGDALMFELRPGARSFCQILVRKGRKAAMPLSRELDRTWSEWHARQQVVAETPDPAQLDLPGGLRLAQRVGRMQTGTGVLLTMLNVFQKADLLVSVMATASDSAAFERCSPATGEFLASLRIDPTPSPTESVIPKSDPKVAARFNNSVTGTWRYASGNVDPTSTVLSTTYYEVDVRFAADGTYRIAAKAETESGTYQVKGQQIVMRPRQAEGKAPYTLDWFFGDPPGSPGNSGLILRCSTSHWLGSFGGSATGWRPFKPAQ